MLKAGMLFLTATLCADIQVGNTLFSHPVLEETLEEMPDILGTMAGIDYRCFGDETTETIYFFGSVNFGLPQEAIAKHNFFAAAKMINAEPSDRGFYMSFALPEKMGDEDSPFKSQIIRVDYLANRTAFALAMITKDDQEAAKEVLRALEIR